MILNSILYSLTKVSFNEIKLVFYLLLDKVSFFIFKSIRSVTIERMCADVSTALDDCNWKDVS